MACKIGVVPNPFILDYLRPFNKLIPKDEVATFNFDEFNNEHVTDATVPPVYEYSNEIRETSNMYYIDVNSDCIPNNNSKKEYYMSLDQSEKRWIPLDYILFTRSDGSNFLLAENISEKENYRGLKSYSIIRYSGASGEFYETTLYSDGIDMSRIKANDQAYIDAVGDVLLSERRIEEALLPVDRAKRYKGSDDITHAGGYVGYLDKNLPKDPNTGEIEVSTSLEGDLTYKFQNDVKEKGLILRDDAPIDSLVRAFRNVLYRFKKLFSKEATWGGVAAKPHAIPEEKLKDYLTYAPIEEEVIPSQDENSEKIEISQEVENNQEVDNEVANQSENEHEQQGFSLREMRDSRPEHNVEEVNLEETKSKDKKEQEEIDK